MEMGSNADSPQWSSKGKCRLPNVGSGLVSDKRTYPTTPATETMCANSSPNALPSSPAQTAALRTSARRLPPPGKTAHRACGLCASFTHGTKICGMDGQPHVVASPFTQKR